MKHFSCCFYYGFFITPSLELDYYPNKDGISNNYDESATEDC